MSQRPSPLRLDPAFWELHQSATNLTRYACIISSRHIKDGALRGRFNREMAYYVRQVVDDVRNGRITAGYALNVIEVEHKSLGQIALDFVNKGGGLVAGGFQVVGGGFLCGTIGGCVVGLPLALHGANNVYENGTNLLTGREDTEGPVRIIYQQAATLLGGTSTHGNMAYGFGDIGFSLHGISKKVLIPGTFKLFRNIDSDYIRTYRLMGKPALWFEVFSNYLVLDQIYSESKK